MEKVLAVELLEGCAGEYAPGRTAGGREGDNEDDSVGWLREG